MVQMKLDKSSGWSFDAEDFISHMVQMKRVECKRKMRVKKIFISHMVQMKPSRNFETYRYKTYFISHMVQMKLSGHSNLLSVDITLYPTWFR